MVLTISNIAIVAGAAVIGAVLKWLWTHFKYKDFLCFREITLSLDETATPPIEADPDQAKIHFGGSVNWILDTQPGDQVDIEFVEKKGVTGGPFKHNKKNKANPKRGHYNNLKGDDLINSNASDKDDEWKYKITWKRQNKDYIVDPSVWIKK